MKTCLKYLRKSKNVTQEELAKYLGVNQSLICRVENGTKSISLDLASEIANYLNVSLDELAGRTPKKGENKNGSI